MEVTDSLLRKTPFSFAEISFSTLVLRTGLTLLFLYYSSFIYNFARNCLISRSTGLPSIFVTWDQNSLAWILTSVPLRHVHKRYLPSWISNSLSIVTYNWEYLDRLRPFRELEAKGKPSHTFQLVTCGKFEVWTRDREIACEILRRPDDFLVFEFSRIFMDKFGPNVFTTDNPAWKRHRKVVATVLNEKISALVFKESLKQTDGMLDELKLSTMSKVGDTTITPRIFDMMKKLTIHVLSGAGMGVSPSWNDKEGENPRPGSKMTYIDAVKFVIDCMAGPMVLPRSVVRNWPSLLPGAALFQKLGIAMDEFAEHTNRMIDEKRLEQETSPTQRPDILTQLVQASEQAAQEDRSNTKYGALSQEEMSGNLFIFTVAGFDTTANTLSYAIVLAARYPQWQDWLLEEIDAIVPQGTESSDWEYTELFPKAQRTLAFMLETLRLQPPIVHEIKSVHSPQTITTSHGTYHIPSNTTLYINNVALHLDPHVWRDLNHPIESHDAPHAEPSPWAAVDGSEDETRFRPTRWIDKESGTIFQPPRGAFLPWSMGPRVCPGQKMAQVEFVTIFLRILVSCRIEAEPLDISKDGTLRKENTQEVNARLDTHVRSSTALLALQMDGVYDVESRKGEGLRMKLTRRRRNTKSDKTSYE